MSDDDKHDPAEFFAALSDLTVDLETAGRLPGTPPDIVADIRAMADRLKETPWFNQPRTHYADPDEPRDVKMASELMTQFRLNLVPVDSEGDWMSAARRSHLELTGIPIEEAARQVNLHWLQQVTGLIEEARGQDDFGDVADWVVICSAHLFENWAEVEGIDIIHNDHLPPFSLFLARSVAWFSHQIRSSPSPLGMLGRPHPGDSVVIPLFKNQNTQEPTDG